MNLKPRFMLLTAIICMFSAVAVYYSVNAFAEKIIEQWAPRFIAKQALYDTSRTLQPILHDLALARQIAASQSTIDWAQKPSDPKLKRQGLIELERYKSLFKGHNYFIAFSSNGAFHYNNEANTYKGKELRYFLDQDKKSDSWFKELTTAKRPIHIRVNTNIELDLTQLWIDVLIQDGEKNLGIVGTGRNTQELLNNIAVEDDPGVTSLFVDHLGTIQIHRNIDLIDIGPVTQKSKSHKNIEYLFQNQHCKKIIYQAMTKLEAKEEEIVTKFVTLHGQKKLLGIIYIPELDWHAITLIDLDTVLPQSEFRNIIVMYILTLLLAFILFNLALNRVVLTPLSYLINGMSQIEKGEKPQGYLKDPPKGEVGKLITRFTQMAQNIVEARKNLEKTVHDRTAELERLTQIDPLTELYNRRGMTELMNHDLNRAQRDKKQVGILWLDVDWFKSVNDTFGHATGDQALKAVAHHIKETLRSYDLAARWGGDEFLILLQCADEKILFDIAERLRLRVAEHIFTTKNLSLTISIGGALSQDEQEIEKLLQDADQALYLAKEKGRNCFCMLDKVTGKCKEPAR